MAERPEHRGADRPAELLARHYGIAAKIVPLASEVERTDEIRTPEGLRLILKTSSRAEARESFAFQSGVLAGLEGHGAVVAPRLIRTRDGSAMFHDGETCGYLQTRLDGTPLHSAAQTPALVFGTGRSLARLNLALGRCSPPGGGVRCCGTSDAGLSFPPCPVIWDRARSPTWCAAPWRSMPSRSPRIWRRLTGRSPTTIPARTTS
ncbi:phosphotransferase [Alloyangia pacifica]|uniref:phosphotransferase n=1 Tax=Alloyangia pacifica TaxID=311180 RepID=UPI0034A0B492